MIKRTSELKKEQVVDKTYLKLCMNKTHFGPISQVKANRTKAALSAAANKVRVLADFTVQVVSPKSNEGDKQNYNRSCLLEFSEADPNEAIAAMIYIMEAWNQLYSDDGTPEYKEKLTEALSARSLAYSSLGINPNSATKPNLSAEQRTVYNSIVGPKGFDYYEYHLAFKLEGEKKFQRSVTYRSLKPLNTRSMLLALNQKAETLQKQFIITAKPKN